MFVGSNFLYVCMRICIPVHYTHVYDRYVSSHIYVPYVHIAKHSIDHTIVDVALSKIRLRPLSRPVDLL